MNRRFAAYAVARATLARRAARRFLCAGAADARARAGTLVADSGVRPASPADLRSGGRPSGLQAGREGRVGAAFAAALLGVLLANRVEAQAPPVCGNAVVEAPETCDDGNIIPGDGCSPLCQTENRAPDCAAATPSAADLWPPNHKLTDVFVLGVTDPDGDPVAVAITAITQDEPLDDAGDGAFCPDGIGVGTDRASLRVERSGQGDGRVYHVSFAAADGRGGTCTGTVVVCVRHDRRPGGTCGDQGPLVDSTTGAAACTDGTCEPEDCTPGPDDLAPPECRNDTIPPGVEVRVDRARNLLERVARAGVQRKGRRAGLAAARQLRRAAASAHRAREREALSEACAEALAERLGDAGACAACTAE
jgi:cysteine-rich repeat protein